VVQTSRRRFLKTCAAVSVTPLVAEYARAAHRNDAGIGAVVVEASSEQAMRFGTRLGGYGASVHEIDADVTSLWYEHLDRQWRTRPVAISGMTLRPALFCLEQLALTHGLRVVHHGRHMEMGAARTSHALAGPSASYVEAALHDAGSLWPATLADHLQLIEPPARPASADGALAGTPLLADEEARVLHSWIIAPVRRRV
jgi:hypothetical protein